MSREYQPPDNKIEQPLPTDKGGLPKTTCPSCGYGEMDSASCVTGEKVEPQPGDFSLCLNCGEWLVYNDILVPRLARRAEVESLDETAKAQLTRASKLIKQRGPIPRMKK